MALEATEESSIYDGIHVTAYDSMFDRSDERYQINPNVQYENANLVALPPALERVVPTIIQHGITHPRIKAHVDFFCRVLVENFPPEILSNFYRNITTLRVNRTLSGIFNGSSYHSALKNYIEYIGKNDLFHELFHMASASYKDGIYYDGLSQYYFIYSPNKKLRKSDIGDGINEGYTQLLTDRYFNKGRKSKTYSKEITCAKCVEKIVGKEELRNCYFTNDLQGLIDRLAVYSGPEKAKQFIIDLDTIHKEDNKIVTRNRGKVQKALDSVKEFLATTYMNKLLNEYEKGLIDRETVTKEYAEFLSVFEPRVYVGPHKYTVNYGVEKERSR